MQSMVSPSLVRNECSTADRGYRASTNACARVASSASPSPSPRAAPLVADDSAAAEGLEEEEPAVGDVVELLHAMTCASAKKATLLDNLMGDAFRKNRPRGRGRGSRVSDNRERPCAKGQPSVAFRYRRCRLQRAMPVPCARASI